MINLKTNSKELWRVLPEEHDKALYWLKKHFGGEERYEMMRDDLLIRCRQARWPIASEVVVERKVVDIVDGISPDEPNTKIIYVEGYERGNYWTIKEYTKAHLPQDKKDKYNVRLPKLD